MTERLRIIVSGLVALHPFGGVAWDYMQYVMGLHRLGHDVIYHEDTWSWPYDPETKARTDDPASSVAFLDRFFRRWAPELTGKWHYRHLHRDSHGMEHAAFRRAAREADLFLNVSGANLIPEDLSSRCVRVFVDTDPGYNQIVLVERPSWSENVDRWAELVRAHDRHATYGENIGAPDCGVPDAGIAWTKTRMPIVLDVWKDLPSAPRDAPWTTVTTWNAFAGPLVHRGKEYFSKDRSFEAILDLPRRVDAPLAVALGGMGAPAERFRSAGWRVEDGPAATRTPETYREYVAASRGEISASKHVYVALRTGWFSCRSACYLAAGRPVVVEDTGFTGVLPAGEGIVAFTTAEEAADGIRAVETDYPRHSRAARELAGEHFAAERVLESFLDEILG